MHPTIDPPAISIEEESASLVFGGGCFWGVEAYFSLMPGVLYTDVGYANGTIDHPSYESVCSGRTNAVEAVRVIYDPQQLTPEVLFTGLFRIIDPTTLNRQGADFGSQYRSGIYYLSEEDETRAKNFIQTQKNRYSNPIVVEVEPLRSYYLAETYHQRYLQKNPKGYCHLPSSCFEEVRQGAPAVSTSSLDPSRYHRPNDLLLRNRLSAESWRVTQESGTEAPFSHPYHGGSPGPGLYVDVTTGEPLFLSRNQYNAGCGWPSFSEPVNAAVLTTKEDVSLGMVRTEVRSRVGDSHLGHVFDDGPKDLGGLRYCINGAALRFIPKDEMKAEGYGDLIERLD